MKKAQEFIEQFRKPIDMMFDTIDAKDTAVCVFVYVRDKKDKSEWEDWKIKYSRMSKMTRYDSQSIKDILWNEIDKLWMGI